MGFIPAADTAEVVMTYTLPDGNQAKNVYNVREANITSWSPTALNLLCDEFEDWETSTAKTMRSTGVLCTRIAARDLSSENGAIVERVVAIAGTVASPVLPANVTFAIKSSTGFAGRSFRGRTFWIGINEGAVTGDILATAWIEFFIAAMEALQTALLANGWVPVVVSRYSGGSPRSAAVVTDIISYSATDNIIDTQRRRLRR